MNGFGDKLSQMQTEAMLKMAANKLGQTPDEVKNALQSGDVDSLTASLGEDERRKVNAVLSDPEAMRKILSDPKVKQLLESFNKSR